MSPINLATYTMTLWNANALKELARCPYAHCLIDRHMSRHREKDAEAGGEGMGKLQTRKRLWRDSNGTVVAKRRWASLALECPKAISVL